MKAVLSLVALLYAAGLVPAHAHAHAQTAARTRPRRAQAEARADTHLEAIVAGLRDKDQDVAREAVEALIGRGAEAVPHLERLLKSEKSPVVLARAAFALGMIEPNHPSVVPALVRLVKGRGLFDSQETLLARRAAGMSLALTHAGLRALPGLLKDDDTFVRRSAAFALDERTEALDALTPEVKDALADLLPAMVGALGDVDEVVRVMSCEALGQVVRSKVEPLSSGAERLLKESGRSRGRCLCECE